MSLPSHGLDKQCLCAAVTQAVLPCLCPMAQAHKFKADAAVKGSIPTIVRSRDGGGGSRDLHLDNFNVSNGGKVRELSACNDKMLGSFFVTVSVLTSAASAGPTGGEVLYDPTHVSVSICFCLCLGFLVGSIHSQSPDSH